MSLVQPARQMPVHTTHNTTSHASNAKGAESLATLMLPHVRLLGWIAAFRTRHQQAPLLPDILEAFGNACLEWLEEMERVECIHRTAEGRVQLTTVLAEIPVIGQVAAGVPIEAIELRQEQLSLPLDGFPERPTYLLRVKGDSMINAGIHDGDLIAIKKSGHARDGAIIVARVNNEVTVKRLRIGTQQVSLLPENDAYRPICVAPADLVVEGVFVGVVRQPRGLH